MAIENTRVGKGTPLAANFDLVSASPLDSRSVVETYAGLAALVNAGAAYEGMRVFVETGDTEHPKGNYQYINSTWVSETAELINLINATATAAMEFKGTTAKLPTNPTKGDFYKVTTAFAIGSDTAKIGDSIVYDGTTWCIIPSGDDLDDTWRPITDVNNDATLTFTAGDKLDVAVTSTGTVTYSHETIAAPTNTNADGDQKSREYITAIETDGFGHITGYKTNIEDIENTTYTFEGQGDEATSVYFQVTASEENASANVIYLDTYSKNEIAAIIGAAGTPEVKDDEGNTTQAAVPGTGIFANIYSKDEITALIKNVTGGQSAGEVLQKLDEYKTSNDAIVKGYEKDGSHVDGLVDKVDDLIAIGATKVEASSTNGNIKINGVETTIYALEGEVYSAEDKAKLAGIEASAEVNVLEGIKLGSADSDVLAILENKTTVIPVASDATLGIVKSSTAENKVSVDTDGIMEVNSLNTNKLVQTAGEWLILNGGNASLSEAPTTEAE
jgi:hypothetical protein